MKAILLCIAALSTGAAALDYQREIAPILRSYCAGCHNDRELDGDLSMETYAALRKGGEKGDPLKADEKGLLLQRVIESAGKMQMPPKDEPQLPAEELATLKRWSAAGAPGPADDIPLFKALTVPRIAPQPTAKHPITGASFSPDGGTLAVAVGNTVELRKDGTTVRKIEGFPGKVNAVHFSPDGKHVVAATGVTGLNGVAQLRNAADGNLVREFGGASDVLYDAEFSPDGSLVATAGYDRVIRLYQAADGKLIRSIDVHKGAVFDLTFHPGGGILASASADSTVKLWRVRDGERLDTLNQPLGEQFAVLFSKDGNQILSAGADKRIHLWKLVSREKAALNPLLLARFAHEAPVTGLALSSDGKTLISSADDRTLKQWSLPDLVERHAWKAQPASAQVLVSHPSERRFLVGRMDGTAESIALAAAAGNTAPPKAPARPAPPVMAEASEVAETEPNNTALEVRNALSVPVTIKGAISQPGDVDCFRFRAVAGQEVILDVDAASAGSKLDSRLEVLTSDGRPVEQVVLQAVKDSWFTFRGKDSTTSDDFRVQNWREMELNEYLYCNGEVVKLWMYPRGPDSGFRVYPGTGNRQAYFQTTPLAHPLGEFCSIVQPLPPGSNPPPNGLPLFRLNYENDDEPGQKRGADSLLCFKAPADGEYVARLTDVRGFGAEKGHQYTLRLRAPAPAFTVKIGGRDPKISPGSGRELTLTANRTDGFDGPIRVEIANLPPGFHATSPVVIEAGQLQAETAIYANADAAAPDEAAIKAVKVTATAMVHDKEVTQNVGDLGKIQLGEKAKVTVEILPSKGEAEAGKPVELTVHPGETITARVRIQRHDFKNRVGFGNDESGRNLPHGVFVDNIGLNGLLIVEGQNEREFSITAAPIAQPMERYFHLKAGEDGGQVSRPALIRVLPKKP